MNIQWTEETMLPLLGSGGMFFEENDCNKEADEEPHHGHA